jgi:hypothetical protein
MISSFELPKTLLTLTCFLSGIGGSNLFASTVYYTISKLGYEMILRSFCDYGCSLIGPAILYWKTCMIQAKIRELNVLLLSFDLLSLYWEISYYIRAPARNIKEFSTFNGCFLCKNCPSARRASTANVVYGDGEVFGIKTVFLNYIS